MLVAFALENYTCFRDRHELNVQALPHTSDLHAFDSTCIQAPRLNRVTAIYGPNGTGKSRLLGALMLVRHLVIGSAKDSQEGEPLPYSPFLFDVRTRTRPTTFEIHFIESGTYFEYGFAYDHERIHEESLFAWSSGRRKRLLLQRRWMPKTKKYECTFGNSVTGAKAVWQQSTRPNALLVSVASQLNSDVFKPVVRWFKKLAGIGPAHFPDQYTAQAILEDGERKMRVLRILHDADIAVAGLSVQKDTQSIEAIRDNVPPSFLKMLTHTRVKSVDFFQTRFAHPVRGTTDRELLDLDEESDGTQRLFALAVPWLDLLDQDLVVLADELDRSLHPLLVASLIGRINSVEFNDRVRRAQLVTTLHDTYSLRDALGRGQVWFTEKDEHEAATLTPLSDYQPRKHEALERRYLNGAYGGTPVIATPEIVTAH